MKKIAKLSMLVLLVLVLATSMVSAVSQADLKGDVLNLIKKLDLKRDYTAAVETVFNSIELDADTVSKIEVELNYIETELAYYNYDIENLDRATKEALLSEVQYAADLAGLKVSPNYDDKTIEVYKDDKKIVAASYDQNFAQTGSSAIVFVGLSVVAVIAVAATVVAKKAKANA